MRCGRWAAATSDRTTRDPGQLSVRLRCLDVRQELSTQPPARCCSALTCRDWAGSRVRTRTRLADGRAGWKAWAVTWGSGSHLPDPHPSSARSSSGGSCDKAPRMLGPISMTGRPLSAPSRAPARTASSCRSERSVPLASAPPRWPVHRRTPGTAPPARIKDPGTEQSHDRPDRSWSAFFTAVC
ncbi:DUF6207 family protein [Streptomyces flavidovirens]